MGPCGCSFHRRLLSEEVAFGEIQMARKAEHGRVIQTEMLWNAKSLRQG